MSDIKYTVAFGDRCTVIPGAAAEKIINGTATAGDIRALLAVIELNARSGLSVAGRRDTAYRGALLSDAAALSGLAESAVETSMAFWRGCGVISVSECGEPSPDGDSAADTADKQTAEDSRKPIRLSSAPKYSGTQISEILDKDGGALKSMIDECQQLIGHIFNPTEISAVVGMSDWLGLSPEIIITVAAYYTRKKPGCSVRYLERAAADLVNNGVTSMEALDAYLKEMELYDGLAGKLRSWLGIGTRAYTQKENAMIKRWVCDFGYGEDVVRIAYEITVDSRGSFNFDYAGKILENWYAAGVRDADGARAAVAAFRDEKEKKSKSESGGSFDTDEFFSLALKRSYRYMQDTDKDKS